MSKLIPLALVACLVAGCSTQRPPLSAGLNTASSAARTQSTTTDALSLGRGTYVKSRAEQIFRAGGSKNFNDAYNQAMREADQRYPATDITPTPARRRTVEVSAAELDAARGK